MDAIRIHYRRVAHGPRARGSSSLPLTPPLLPPQLAEGGEAPDGEEGSHLTCPPRQSVCLPQPLSSVIRRSVAAPAAAGGRPWPGTSVNTAVVSARAEPQATSHAEHLDFGGGEPSRSCDLVLG